MVVERGNAGADAGQITVNFIRLGQPTLPVAVLDGSTVGDALNLAGIPADADVRENGTPVTPSDTLNGDTTLVVALSTKVENGCE